jgi:diaminopropionate ammonia-lyase
VSAAGGARAISASLYVNPRASRAAYRTEESRIISLDAARRALREIETWPGYAASPLHDLPKLSKTLGVAAVACKDESARFGLGSFKALGGAYAAVLALRRGEAAAAGPTLCCATDGNHGQSVAYAAGRHGLRCIIFVHEHAPMHKIVAMQGLGAAVVRVPGNYDESVRHAERMAVENGWLLISDTSDVESDPIVADVMHGYGVMALEMMAQWHSVPSHVFVQAGVGGLAAAIAGCFAERYAADRPRLVIVEPESAACVMQAVLNDGPKSLPGDLSTDMAMLSCGRASAPAWTILSTRADAFMTVADSQAAAAAELLHTGADGMLKAGASASSAAGFAGAVAAAADERMALKIGLERSSRVLILATEGGA